MRNKLNIRASWVDTFTQCSTGYSFTWRPKMLTFLSLIAANILHESIILRLPNKSKR